jgi:hypothetical protein
MRIGAVELSAPLAEFRKPHALALLRPRIDVRSAGTLSLSQLESQFGAKELRKLAKPRSLFHFTRYRPAVHFEIERMRIGLNKIRGGLRLSTRPEIQNLPSK